MLSTLWRAIVGFIRKLIRLLIGGGFGDSPPPVKGVFYSGLSRVRSGLLYMVEGVGGSASWTSQDVQLDINGGGPGSIAVTRSRARRINGADWFVQIQPNGAPTAPDPGGGGIGSTRITVNGNTGECKIGYGDPPPEVGEPPPDLRERPPARPTLTVAGEVTFKPVFRFSVPTKPGMTVLIEGCSSNPLPPSITDARLDVVTVGGGSFPNLLLNSGELGPYGHLSPDGYFVHLNLAAGGPAGDGKGTIRLTLDDNGTTVNCSLEVGYGEP